MLEQHVPPQHCCVLVHGYSPASEQQFVVDPTHWPLHTNCVIEHDCAQVEATSRVAVNTFIAVAWDPVVPRICPDSVEAKFGRRAQSSGGRSRGAECSRNSYSYVARGIPKTTTLQKGLQVASKHCLYSRHSRSSQRNLDLSAPRAPPCPPQWLPVHGRTDAQTRLHVQRP